MPSINLNLDYFDHRKTNRLVLLLGKDSDVLPLRLWCYCGRYHPDDGALAGYSAQELESRIGWRGRPGAAIDALVEVGFLDRMPDGKFQVHDWQEHAGHFKVYRERSQKAWKARWEGGSSADASSNATNNASSLHCSGDEKLSSEEEVKVLRKKFTPPTVKEVATYCKEKGYGFSPEAFVAYYESNGWRVGRNPMKKWQGACVTWQKNFEENGRKKSTGPVALRDTHQQAVASREAMERRRRGES